MSHTGKVIIAKLTCNTTWAGILVLIKAKARAHTTQ